MITMLMVYYYTRLRIPLKVVKNEAMKYNRKLTIVFKKINNIPYCLTINSATWERYIFFDITIGKYLHIFSISLNAVYQILCYFPRCLHYCIASHLSDLYQINMVLLLHIYLEIKKIDGLIMVPTD